MCSGPRKPSTPPPPSATTTTKDSSLMAAATAVLLELAAADDVVAFKRLAEDAKSPAMDAMAHWYGPSATTTVSTAAGGRLRLRLEARTPAMIAALYGSTGVLSYILSSAPSEATRASPTDGATPLHLAAAGGAASAAHLLLAAGASPDSLSLSGLRPGDLLTRSTSTTTTLRVLLKSPSPSSSPKKSTSPSPPQSSPSPAAVEPRKEYPPDLTLPDLKTGLFSTDEFRMYSFKVKPCSRAYSHDWTECPFVHPGENARRRDPRRYSYSCVPCPEFRKGGACRKGDGCEYAHGVFECWLHPAQYRTRLCKDEVGCARRICFFAHQQHELRAVNPSAVSVGMQPTGSVPAVSSPRSSPPNGGMDLVNAAAGWPSSPASRLKSALAGAAGREMVDFDLELLALDQYQQKISSPRASWGGMGSPMTASAAAAATAAGRTTVPDYADLLGSVDPAMLSQLHALSLKQAGDMPPYGGAAAMADAHMPTSPMVGANAAAFGGGGMDHSSMAKAIMSSRASAFAKRSQSFIDRGGRAAPPAAAARSLMSQQSQQQQQPSMMLSDWGSPDGRLDWGVQGDELHYKFRKSASFAFRGRQSPPPAAAMAAPPVRGVHAEPDVSWVSSLVKDGLAGDVFAAQWPEQEQMVA